MQVGIIGWRGMVGSVLVQRMREERDFDLVDPVFFSTSQAGGTAPAIGKTVPAVKDANDVTALAAMDVLISCQGGEYTADIHPKLRKAGWTGYWIDAARQLRMADDAVIILDPVNRQRDRPRARSRPQGLHRRQLHRQPDADGHGRPVPRRPDRVDDVDDLSGGVGRRREAHARAGVADGTGHASVADLLADPASSILDIDRV